MFNSADLVTVCIPVFNGARTIADAIASVALQIDEIRELVIVENQSNDGTLAVVHKVIRELKIEHRTRVVQNAKHLPVALNWNRCLELATTDYVKILCADDLIYSGAILKQASLAQAAGSPIALVASRRDIISSGGLVLFRSRGGFSFTGEVLGDDLVPQIVRSGTNLFGETVSVLFSRKRALEVGGFRADFPYMMDLDLWIRMVRGKKLVLSSDCVGAFRVSRGAWSASIGLMQGVQAGKFFRQVRTHIPEVTMIDLVWGECRAYLFSLLRGLIYLGLRWTGK